MNKILEILGLGGRILEARIENKATQIKAKSAAVLKGMDGEASWEAAAAMNASNSWADEYWTLLLSIPLVLAFLGFHATVTNGFNALRDVPQWYTWAVLASVSFAFARKKLPPLTSWARNRK
jgi:hypothetical protein